MPELSRRDFLKIAALASAGTLLPKSLIRGLSTKQAGNSTLPNVIIFVFDAMTARDLSIYGFPRKTTPNFEKFAQHATVYHSHYSAGNYTIPGTASLLTGMYPWTHRAINHAGQVLPRLADRNIFRLFGDAYNRYGFAQNAWADIFLNQFNADVDHHLPVRSFGAISPWMSVDGINDGNMGYRGVDNFLFSKDAPTGSLLFGLIDRMIGFEKAKQVKDKEYPLGLPSVVTASFYYRLSDIIDGLGSLCSELKTPSLSYLHIQAPHEPYRATRKFYSYFKDDWVPPSKPRHKLALSGDTEEHINVRRLSYDRFIANVDEEFGRLMNRLDALGIRDNSYIILTSDHGDMFERGERGHSTPLLFDPVIHIPLIISAPGQVSRKDVHTRTSSVDILPTLLHLCGREIPDWCEGELLPELGGHDISDRSIFSIEAKLNSAFAPLTIVTVAMQKGRYKIILYRGYKTFGTDVFEAYDLENDPEELDDLVLKNDPIVPALKDELLRKLEESNKPFEKT